MVGAIPKIVIVSGASGQGKTRICQALVKLAKTTSLNLSDEQLLFLSEVSDFNMEGRYPDEKNQFAQKCTKEFAGDYLRKIKEMYTWLKKQIEK